MSYFRGDYYAYAAGEGRGEVMVLHGKPGSCGCDTHGKFPCIDFPQSKFDELVVMRFAELLKEKKVKRVVTRLVNAGFGNFGTVDILELCGFDPLEDWSREMAQHQRRHLARCKHPKTCGKPGLHRHKHPAVTTHNPNSSSGA